MKIWLQTNLLKSITPTSNYCNRRNKREDKYTKGLIWPIHFYFIRLATNINILSPNIVLGIKFIRWQKVILFSEQSLKAVKLVEQGVLSSNSGPFTVLVLLDRSYMMTTNSSCSLIICTVTVNMQNMQSKNKGAGTRFHCQ